MHHPRAPVPTGSRDLDGDVVQRATAKNYVVPHARVASLEAVVEAAPLALELAQGALDDDASLGAVRVEPLLVAVLRIPLAHHEPRAQRVGGVAVEVVAKVPEPLRRVLVEGAVPASGMGKEDDGAQRTATTARATLARTLRPCCRSCALGTPRRTRETRPGRRTLRRG